MTAITRSRFAPATALVPAILVLALALATAGADSKPSAASGDATGLPPPSNGAISPQGQADALHLVVAADRDVYCRVFAALQGAGGKPGESWPSPCEMFRRASESIQSKGAEFSYALRSLDPIDPRNGPQTELEREGLAFIAGHPGQTYYGREMLGGRRYVTAVYPDLPAAGACVDCHGRRSAAHRPKAGDIIGGVVVRVPLEF